MKINPEIIEDARREIYNLMPYGAGGASVMLLADQMSRAVFAVLEPELDRMLDEHAEKVLEGYARMVEKYMDPDMLWDPASVASDVRCWAEDGMTNDLLEAAETK